MIKNDFRYIIKKIIIGIGIILGISMIKSCNVYALEPDFYNQKIVASNYNPTYSSGNSYNFKINGVVYNIVYDSTGILINNNRVYSTRPYAYQNPWFIGMNSDETVSFYYLYTNIGSSYNASVNSWKVQQYDNNFPLITRHLGVDYDYVKYKEYKFSKTGVLINNPTEKSVSACNYASGVYSFVCNSEYIVYGTNKRFWLRFYANGNTINKYISSDFSSPVYAIPEIVDLNATLNEDDDVLVSVSFSPEFSYIDTTNYNYYAWFEGYNKFLISENNPTFNTQNNTTFYVEITDKNGNTIDSESYTVSRIGQYDVSEYQIIFSSESYTESDATNDPKPIDYINRVDIDITYMPKSPYLKYQYQFVADGDSLTDNWILVNNNDNKNNFVYTTNVKGTLYARILDKEDNYVKGSTFTVSTIGDVKYYSDSKGVSGFFIKLMDKLDYSGPISSLISVPIRLFSSLLAESSKTCSPYSFGNLLGANITFSCVNVENYIGSNLYHLLDLLMSFGLVLGIIHFIKKQYNKFTTLNDKSDDVM